VIVKIVIVKAAILKAGNGYNVFGPATATIKLKDF